MKKQKKRFFSKMSKLAKVHRDNPEAENKLASIYKRKKRINQKTHEETKVPKL